MLGAAFCAWMKRFLNAVNDCDQLEKGAPLSIFVDLDNKGSINDLQFRSRYGNVTRANGRRKKNRFELSFRSLLESKE